MSSPASDLRRNQEVYHDFWGHRWRRIWTYSSQTKVKRFRSVMRKYGLLDSPTALRVYDQGFGLGLMLFSFPKNCFLAGHELSSNTIISAQTAARRLGYASTDLRIYEPAQPLPDQWLNSFDVVISSHVLEHIAEPKLALAQILTLLKPGGYACILVPINELLGEDANHYYIFSEASLSAMLHDLSMEIVSCDSVDRLYRLIKPLSLARQRHDTVLLRIISKIVNGVLAPLPFRALRGIDRILSKIDVPPTQCILLARKNLA